MIDIQTIIAFTLFGVSEILPILPMPANGILHSIIIGLQNSFSNKPVSSDIEIARSLISNRPNMANLVSTLDGNYKLFETLKILNDNPHLIVYIDSIAYNKDLQFINNILMNNPNIINELKSNALNIINKTSPTLPDTTL